MAAKQDSLNEMLKPVVETMGYEFVGLEYISQGRHSILRIYIDQPETGITVDDCATVSRQVSAVLDVEDPIKEEYNLEVSSPGLDRPLFEPEHYQRFVGEKVKLRTQIPLLERGQRKFTGIIQSADDEKVVLLIDDTEEVEIAFDIIEKANLVPVFK